MFIKKNLSGITHYLKLPRHPLLCMFFLFASKYMVQVCLFSLSDGEEGLDDFTECLSKFTKFNSFRSLATLSYASDIYSGSSIVSRYWKFSHFTLIIVFPYLTVFHTQLELLLSVCCSTCLIVTEGQIVKLFFLFYSIEFDRDCDFFAIAGVTKKIKVIEMLNTMLKACKQCNMSVYLNYLY